MTLVEINRTRAVSDSLRKSKVMRILNWEEFINIRFHSTIR